MASSSHPSFPSRPYTSNLGKLPDRTLGAPFGASTTQQQRENARLERERERAEKERLEREEQNQLTEEQREEIKEAVSPHQFPKRTTATLSRRKEKMITEVCKDGTNSISEYSSCSSTSTKTKKSTTTNSKSP